MSWLETRAESHEKLVQAIQDFLEGKTQDLPDLGQGNFERQAYKYALVVHTVADAMDSLLEENIKKAEEQGTPVTCSAGCSACCSQPIGIQFPEVFHIAEYLSRNPASKQNFLKKYPTWRKKIDPTIYELRMQALMTGQNKPEMESIESAVKTFYKDDIPPCPFLEDDFCGIYPARPFVCRQNYALSDPENCRNKSDIIYAVFGDVNIFEMQMSHVMVHVMKNIGLNALVMCNAPMTVREFVVNGKAYIDFYVKNAPKKSGLQNL